MPTSLVAPIEIATDLMGFVDAYRAAVGVVRQSEPTASSLKATC